MRSLVVNADDFGFARDVNRGIVKSHVDGILTATTLMANGREFDDAVRLAREHPSLDVGVHLVLVQGESLLSGAPLPQTLPQLLQAVALKRIRIYDELRAQVERVKSAGILPSHLDTHKHTHLLPPVLDAVCRLGEEFGIAWVRRPFDLPIKGGDSPVPASKRILGRAMSSLRPQFHRKLSRYGCRTTDHFAGFALTGHLQEQQALALIRALPAGSTEFMCHPGFCTDELRSRETRLKESREAELRALTSPALKRLLEQEEIELVNYRQLD